MKDHLLFGSVNIDCLHTESKSLCVSGEVDINLISIDRAAFVLNRVSNTIDDKFCADRENIQISG